MVGHVYAITTVTCRRRPLFTDTDLAGVVAGEIEHSDRQHLSSSMAWVLMPDHLHWLFRLESRTLQALMQRFKMRTAQSLNRIRHSHGSIWQAGFHDRCVRDEASLHRIARYLLENPVRARLVTEIEQYPHAWCAWGGGTIDVD